MTIELGRVQGRVAPTIVWAIAVNALCILPSFLVGSLALLVRADFALDSVAVGTAISGFWLVASLGAVPCSRLVGRFGPMPVLRMAGFSAAVASLSIALFSHTTLVFVIIVAAAGIVPALATPALSVVIMSAVAAGRQAFALTAAGASPVFSLMLAGLAAPLAAVAIGWRGVFLASGLLVLVLALAGIRLPTPKAQPVRAVSQEASPRSLAPLIVMMVGVAFGNTTIGAATSFFVVAAPYAGVVAADAALTVAVASLVSVLFRLFLSLMVDRRRTDPIRLVGLFLLLGAAGLVLLGLGVPALFFVGLVFVLVPGWSWVSFLLYAVLARYRHNVAGASGVVQMVFFVGGVTGPLLMGFVVGLTSFAIAWWVLAVLDVIAAFAVFLSIRRLPRFIAE